MGPALGGVRTPDHPDLAIEGANPDDGDITGGVPRLGAATVLALIVVGQMLGSLVFDHFGLFGLSPQPVSVPRLAGAASLILGVVLIRL